MKTVMNVAEAKAKLSELIDRALRGEEVWIARNGTPVTCLVPKPAAARLEDAGPFPQRAAVLGILSHLGPVPDEAWSAEIEEWVEEPADPSPMRAVAEPSKRFDHNR